MTDTTRPQHHAVLRVEYDGTPFSGWTRQPRDRATIEQAMLDAFERIGCSDVQLRCAGRTDAGVHATAQVIDATYSGCARGHGSGNGTDRLQRALRCHLARI